MNKLLTFAALLLWGVGFSQQQYNTDSVTVTSTHPQQWVTYLENQDFKIEYRFAECDPSMGYDKEMVLLRFSNQTADLLSFDWHMILYYSPECKTCDYYDEYHYTVNVSPGKLEEGNCEMYSDYQLKIFSAFIDEKFNSGEKLRSFELRGLNVTAVQID